MNIRKFEPRDAEFCFEVRKKAFIKKFDNELSSKEIAACIKAYNSDDYILMAEKNEFFIVEKDYPVGFFTLKRIDLMIAEIPLIYIDLNHVGMGIGKACIQYIQDWITANWIEVKTLFLDTIIPKNNSGFYEKTGFSHIMDTFCYFQKMRIKAARYSKKIK